MKELFLIRHGEAEHMVAELSGGWSESKLTELGKKQAEKTGQKLKAMLNNKNFYLYISDLSRASETAKIIGNILTTSVIFSSDLRELNTGSAINKTKKEKV